MKRLSALLIIFALLGCSEAQTASSRGAAAPQEKQPNTAIETFMGRRGVLLIKEFYDLGRMSGTGGIRVQALIIREQSGAARKTKGLRIEVTEAGRLERTNVSFVDLEELQGLSDGLAYMADLAKKWVPTAGDPYTEVEYISKGEFRIGFYKDKSGFRAFCQSGVIGSVQASVDISGLLGMKTLVDQAITLLKDK
jgi:hypothetical protein